MWNSSLISCSQNGIRIKWIRLHKIKWHKSLTKKLRVYKRIDKMHRWPGTYGLLWHWFTLNVVWRDQHSHRLCIASCVYALCHMIFLRNTHTHMRMNSSIREIVSFSKQINYLFNVICLSLAHECKCVKIKWSKTKTNKQRSKREKKRKKNIQV